MKYCARCLYPSNHPLNLVFDSKGVCSGCRIHEEKDSLDWAVRRNELGRLLNRYRNRSGNNYDCIIPVSGAGDSYFIVDTVKNEFGLNPLLVHYNKHYNTAVGHRNLAYLRTVFDCDIYQMVLAPDVVKRITQRSLVLRGSIYWHCLAGQTVFPVQVAVRYKIPLIIWGVHQGVDQVGMYSHLDEVEMTRKYRHNHDLMGLEGEDLVSDADGLPERDLEPYFYPHDKELERVGVRGIYLGNYIRWDTKAQHEEMIKRYGFETARQQRTFDTYNTIDCMHYSGLHDYIKFLKWGYGKATDHATREIRFRRLTRAQGVELAKRYETKKPTDLNDFLNWLHIDETTLMGFVDRHRNSAAWEKSADGCWRLKRSYDATVDKPTADAAALRLSGEDCSFKLTGSRDGSGNEDDYRLISRGYVDGVSAPAIST